MTVRSQRGRRVSSRTAHQADRLTRADRVARGRDARALAPLESHAEFAPGPRDPIGLLLEQDKARVPELVPIRHGRMLASPFAFYRGAALPMAADLATTPTSGLRVQLCGDAHLSNFGAFASPERRLVFDVNDFDETLPGPFEWDVKRLAASVAVAGRDNGFGRKKCRKAVLAAVEGYRAAMQAFATQHFLDVWYAHLDVDDDIREFRSQLKAKGVKVTEKMVAKARTHDSMQALNKLTTVVDGRHRIISAPPLIEPIDELAGGRQAAAIHETLREVLAKYRRTLESDRRHLLEYFMLVEVARKVVGVGSVGTRAWIALLDGGDGIEPLFLQAKEARESVLAAYCGRSRYRNQGERVVAGQRLMQAESDIFLGWHAPTGTGEQRDCYVRQLKDWKGSATSRDRPRVWGLGRHVRLDARSCARSLRRPDRDCRLSGQIKHLRTRYPTSPMPTPTRASATTRRSDGGDHGPGRGDHGHLTAPDRPRPGWAPRSPGAVSRARRASRAPRSRAPRRLARDGQRHAGDAWRTGPRPRRGDQARPGAAGDGLAATGAAPANRRRDRRHGRGVARRRRRRGRRGRDREMVRPRTPPS